MTINLDIVFVDEVNLTEPNKPVSWRLLTSHNTENSNSSEKIVDMYKGRWTIEELNKCAKTGVKLEERQFTDLNHFRPFCAISFVIGWRLLSIRDISLKNSNTPAEEAFSDNEVEYLKAKLGTSKLITIKEGLDHIAQEGGYMGSYSSPGWIILWRGWFKFTLKVDGFVFANSLKHNSS